MYLLINLLFKKISLINFDKCRVLCDKMRIFGEIS